jgi:hypothetical protein
MFTVSAIDLKTNSCFQQGILADSMENALRVFRDKFPHCEIINLARDNMKGLYD